MQQFECEFFDERQKRLRKVEEVITKYLSIREKGMAAGFEPQDNEHLQFLEIPPFNHHFQDGTAGSAVDDIKPLEPRVVQWIDDWNYACSTPGSETVIWPGTVWDGSSIPPEDAVLGIEFIPCPIPRERIRRYERTREHWRREAEREYKRFKQGGGM